MVAETNNVVTMIGGDIVLRFTVVDDAKPPIHNESITVTFNKFPLQPGDYISFKMDENIILITITSLEPADEGIYAVTVETTAGSSTASTWLRFYGEGNL